jgi:hypothetical protein
MTKLSLDGISSVSKDLKSAASYTVFVVKNDSSFFAVDITEIL